MLWLHKSVLNFPKLWKSKSNLTFNCNQLPIQLFPSSKISPVTDVVAFLKVWQKFYSHTQLTWADLKNIITKIIGIRLIIGQWYLPKALPNDFSPGLSSPSVGRYMFLLVYPSLSLPGLCQQERERWRHCNRPWTGEKCPKVSPWKVRTIKKARPSMRDGSTLHSKKVGEVFFQDKIYFSLGWNCQKLKPWSKSFRKKNGKICVLSAFWRSSEEGMPHFLRESDLTLKSLPWYYLYTWETCRKYFSLGLSQDSFLLQDLITFFRTWKYDHLLSYLNKTLPQNYKQGVRKFLLAHVLIFFARNIYSFTVKK